MGKLRAYCLKTLNKLSIYPLGKTLSAPSENKVAIPIPPPGHLVPIKDVEQVLPDKLVRTQIAFNLAEEDQPSLYQ